MASGSVHKMTALCLAVMIFLCSAFTAAPALADGSEAKLEMGFFIAGKMKTLAAAAVRGTLAEEGAEETAGLDAFAVSEDIKAIRMARALPDGFVPAEGNTVSASDSEYPVYIFFDNTDGAGILYFYTEAEKVVMNPDSAFLFAWNTALTDISGVTDWDASQVTDMYGMFTSARSLPDGLALRDWDTSSVTDMRAMFSGAVSMVFLDVSKWNTGNVTSMANTFQVGDSWKANGQLREIVGLGNLDVSNVTDMTCMFYGAGEMTFYDIESWDVSKVESMNHMFCDNRKLRSLDLSAWDVSSVMTMYCMFDDNVSLTTIGDVSHWDTSSLIDIGAWLNNCCSFTGDRTGTFDLSGWDTSHLMAAGEMLFNTRIHTLDLSGWTFDSITNDPWEGAGRGIFYESGNTSIEDNKGMGYMFYYTPQLTTIYVTEEGLKSYNAAVMRGVNVLDMWNGCRAHGFTVK